MDSATCEYMHACGTSSNPHVIFVINGYGTCFTCLAHFKDGVKCDE